jgi:SP family myo-inositol transporter-like MFS transporter 13
MGSIAASQLADRIGRKKTIILAAVFFALGAVEQAAAQVFKELALGRLMVGLGVGLASMVLPMYCSELSPAKFRGGRARCGFEL